MITLKKIQLYRKEKTYVATLCIADKSYEALSHQALHFLHPDEYVCYQALAHPNKKYSYLLGRYCAKQALSLPPFSVQPKDCAIVPGVFGQPVLVSPLYNVHVCLTHCGSLGGALAYPEAHPMGIDIELMDEKKIPILKEQMTHEELAQVAYAIQDEAYATTLLWTIKEALSKIMRTGLMLPFTLLEISKIAVDGEFVYTQFKNFSQYQACSFMFNRHVCSLIYPRQTQIQLDLDGIKILY
jgi:4'-phosphopantetheinyl transferase EntD